MVATRKSLSDPTNNAATNDDSVLPASTGDPKKDRLLKELYIDGNDTLKGEKKQKAAEKQSIDQGKGVYTWRGAVYAITDDTPQEWIEAEAHLHKKKEKEATPPPPAASKNKRVHDNEEIGRPAKKTRTSTPEMMTRAEREAAGTWREKSKSKKRAVPSTAEETNSEERSKTNVEAQKVPAKEPSPEVEMLPEIKVKPREAQKKPTKITKSRKKEVPPKKPSILQRLSGQIEARQLAYDVANMAKLNTRIASLSEEIQATADPDGTLDTLKTMLAPPWPTTEPAGGQSATPPSLTTAETAASPLSSSGGGQTHLVPRSSPDIPPLDPQNRGGQKLRWSLTQSHLVNNPERAENAIFKGRLAGESKTAKRRRVRREIGFVKSLPLSARASAGEMEPRD